MFVFYLITYTLNILIYEWNLLYYFIFITFILSIYFLSLTVLTALIYHIPKNMPFKYAIIYHDLVPVETLPQFNIPICFLFACLYICRYMLFIAQIFFSFEMFVSLCASMIRFCLNSSPICHHNYFVVFMFTDNRFSYFLWLVFASIVFIAVKVTNICTSVYTYSRIR